MISKGLYSRKLNESKAELLYKADDTITMATISYDGKYIYMYNGGIGSLTNLREKITPVIYVLEPSGNVVNTIELDSKKSEICFMVMKSIFSLRMEISLHTLIRAVFQVNLRLLRLIRV